MNRKYRARVWIVLVPGKKCSAKVSRIVPIPSSSTVPFSRKRSMTSIMRRRSASSCASHPNDEAVIEPPLSWRDGEVSADGLIASIALARCGHGHHGHSSQLQSRPPRGKRPLPRPRRAHRRVVAAPALARRRIGGEVAGADPRDASREVLRAAVELLVRPRRATSASPTP